MCESGCGVEEHMDGRGEKGMVGKRRLRRRVQCGGAGRGVQKESRKPWELIEEEHNLSMAEVLPLICF